MKMGNILALCGLACAWSAEAATKLQKEPPTPWDFPGETGALFPLAALALDIDRVEIEEVARLAALDRAQKIEFFTALLANDQAKVCEMLNQGFDPNAAIPSPAPPELKSLVKDDFLGYYVAKETGVTGLMVASTLGYLPLVKILLMAGADPWKVTGRDKTFALWMAGKKENVEIMQSLLKIPDDAEARKLRITVDLELQLATLWRDGKAEFVTSISSGRKGHETKPGHYLVTNKYKMWKSTIYPAQMPNFLRLSCADFGLHAGHLPGYPASHGCIRLPEESSVKLFAAVPIGTIVEIK